MEKVVNMDPAYFDVYRESVRKTCDFLGKGKDGYCFRFEPDKIIKFYKYGYDPKKFNALMSHVNDSVLFPNFAFVVDGKVKGAVRPFAPGKTLNYFENYGNDVDLEVIIKAFTKLKDDLIELSKEKILVKDPIWSNIVWDGENFRIIDTLHYKKSIFSEYWVELANARNIFDSINNWLIDPDLFFFLMNTKCNDYLLSAEYVKNPDLMIYQIKEFLENYFQEEIPTFGEASKKLALIKH